MNAAVFGQSRTATTTSLAVTSGGTPVTSVEAGSVITMTATVSAGSAAVHPGEVSFCDGAAKHCTGIHLLGTVQLNSTGTAALKIRPGLGSHLYQAVFQGTTSLASSSSSTATVTAAGKIPQLSTRSTIDQTGGWGAYALSGTVTEIGNTTPPTGSVSFIDTNHGNAVLGTAALGSAVRGVAWNTVNTSAPGVAGVEYAVADLNGDGIPDLFVKDYFGTYDVLLGNGDGSFTVKSSPFGPSSLVGSFVVGDFNNDGIPDVAAINAVEYAPNSTITIFLGNGDGTFTIAASSPATGEDPSAITTADINGDGNTDLIVAQRDSSGNGQILIFYGNGEGTFTQSASAVSTASPANSIVPADINGDGKTDLVLAEVGQTGIGILLGNGNGTFSTVAGPGPLTGTSVTVADLNNDGIPDLAFPSSPSNDLTVYLGKGDGTFTQAPSGPIASLPVYNLVVGDFNQDGIPDLVYTVPGATAAGVLFGNGDGSFTQVPATLTYGYDFSDIVVVADFNGDGWPDVLTEDGNTRTVIDSLTQPTETASALETVSIPVAGTHLTEASYAGDGSYTPSFSGTIALVGTPPATTTTLTLTSGGSPVTSVASGSVVTLTASVTAGATPVTTGQVDFCDAAVSSCTDIHLLGTASLTSKGSAAFRFVPGAGTHTYKAVLLENADGLSSSSNVQSLTVGPAPSPVYSDTTAIAVGGRSASYTLTATVVGYGGTVTPTGNVSFLDTSFGNANLGTAYLGNGTAGLGWLISQTPTLSSTPVAEVTADFNGDGIPDLALLWTSGSYGSGPYSVTILFGSKDGTFTTGPTTTVADVQMEPSMIAADINGDGKTDLAIESASFGYSITYATVILSNGDGTFGAPQTTQAYVQGAVGGDVVAGSMVAADFNGDGKIDLAMVGGVVASGEVTILLGNGDGTFTSSGANYGTNASFSAIATGDFNGDGIPDLVVSNFFSPSGAEVLLGKGDGTFTALPAQIPTGTFVGSIVVGDFNGDGNLDLAFGYSSAVDVYLGNGEGTFRQASGSPINGASLSLVAGDFNHDGKTDFAGIDNYYDQIDIFAGHGDGTFTVQVATPVVGQSTLGPFSLVAADFNGDGVPDLAMLTRNVDTASILLTQPTVTATATVTNIAPVGAGMHNVEASYAGDSHYSASLSGTASLAAGLKPVVISPSSGTYSSVTRVTLTESIPGATIYYAATGPLATAGFVPYTGPIQLTLGGTEAIMAYASETGYEPSTYTTANFALNFPVAPAPIFSPAGGYFAGAETVSLSDSVAGATIYYTTDGTIPTTSSAIYTGPITVSTSETIAAIAAPSGYTPSLPATAQFFIGSSKSSFIYTVAGNQSWGYAGDGGSATVASLNDPLATVVDASGNVYIADAGNNVVRKVAAATSVITTVAGTGTAGYSGDNGPATSAELSSPNALAIDGAGNLYISDPANRVVRMVAASTGTITTVAGSPTATSLGDGGPATHAQLSDPGGLALDSAGDLYIADGSRVRKVAAGIITTVAGTGSYGFTGDNGPATAATFSTVEGLAVDSAGNLYIADGGNNAIRKVIASTGIITTVAGSGPNNTGSHFSGDGGAAASAALYFPRGVAVDAAGDLYIADTYNGAVREVTASTGIINTIVGHPSLQCSSASGDGAPAVDSAACYPMGISLDSAGNLYIAEEGTSRIRKVTVAAAPPATATAAPIFNSPAGTYANGPTVSVTSATPGAEIYLTLNGVAPSTTDEGFHGPIHVTGSVTLQAIAVAPGYLPSAPVSATYTITTPPASVVTTVAGTGVSATSGIGGPATSASLRSVDGVAFDPAGNLYIADANGNAIWKVAAATGTISLAAGTPGNSGFSGDGSLATSALLDYPTKIALDSAGNLYIADTFNNIVRRVDAQTGMISTFAGGSSGALGDGGPASSASLLGPEGLAFDSAGNLYIADYGDHRIRKVAAGTGIITTVAGTGTIGPLGDGGPATAASLDDPNDVALDSQGNLYIAEYGGARVRVVHAATQTISTIAGNGDFGESGDGGEATAAEIDPDGIALDAAGNLYIANPLNEIRMVPAGGGAITAIAGSGYTGFGGDGNSATMAEFCDPTGLAFDKTGSLYIGEWCNNRVRKVTFSATVAPPLISPVPGTYTSAQTVTITDPTAGAVIHYTTDGTTPGANSTIYSGPITISQSESVQAMAMVSGWNNSPVTIAAYTIHPQTTPTVAVVPSASSITTAQSLSVTVTVQGTGSTPTGSVTLSSGSWGAQQTLVAGATTFTVAPGTLPAGSDELTAAYTPDSASATTYTAAQQSVTVAVSSPVGRRTPLVQLTPSPSTITDEESVSVSVSIAGGAGAPTPTGSVTLTAGSYAAQLALANGAATFQVPAGSLSDGNIVATAAYSGDATYAAASGTTTITVTSVVVSAAAPAPVSPGGNSTANLTLTSGSYAGTLKVSCTLTNSPSGAQSLPTCSVDPTTVTLGAGGQSTLTVSIHTTAAGASARLEQAHPILRFFGGGSIFLAMVLWFGIPARGRRWRACLMTLIAVGVFGLTGCGGGNSGQSAPPPPPTPATTAGNYVFTITGVDAANASVITTATIALTVQ